MKNLNGKTLNKVKSISRKDAESNLNFIGFLVMENKLKEQTNQTILTLNYFDIRTVMATGDNILTAISVAKECDIIDEEKDVYFGDLNQNQKIFWKCLSGGLDKENKQSESFEAPWEHLEPESFDLAINGQILRYLLNNQSDSQNNTLYKVLQKAQVYARMSPEDKT